MGARDIFGQAQHQHIRVEIDMAKQKHKLNSGIRESLCQNRPSIKWLYVILAVHVVLALVYWHYTPFGQSPDEGPHSRYVQELVSAHKLPVYTASSADGYEFYQPPLYYMLAAPFYAVGRLAGVADPGVAVRFLSLILGGLSILAAFLGIRRASPKQHQLPFVCAGFIALLPTHVMTSSSVSNDILMELVFGLFFICAAGMLSDGLTRRRTLVMGLVLGAGLLSKLTCGLLFPLALLVYWMAVKRRGYLPKTACLHVLAAFGVSLLVGGWWLIRNQLVYGDPLSMSQFEQSFLSHSPAPDMFFRAGYSVFAYFQMVASWSFDSFWGVFGHMDLFMPAWTYWMIAVGSVAALIGVRKGIIHLVKESAVNVDLLIVYAVTLALVVISFLKLNVTVFQAQGRYLYPALVPISFFWVIGLEAVLPASKRGLIPYVALVIPVVVQIVALTTCILPAIFG